MHVLNSQALYRPNLAGHPPLVGVRPLQPAPKQRMLLTAENSAMSFPALSCETGIPGATLPATEPYEMRLAAFPKVPAEYAWS